MPTASTDTATCPRHPHRPGDPWCLGCRERIANAIFELPDLHHQLLEDDRMGTPIRAERHAVNGDPASPSPLFDFADEIRSIVCDWASAWADYCGKTWTTNDIRKAAAFLGSRPLRRVDLLSTPLAVDLGTEILQIHGAALHHLGGDDEKPVHESLEGPCPYCTGRSCYRVVGTDTVECRDCGPLGDHAEYEAYCAALIQEYDRPYAGAA